MKKVFLIGFIFLLSVSFVSAGNWTYHDMGVFDRVVENITLAVTDSGDSTIYNQTFTINDNKYSQYINFSCTHGEKLYEHIYADGESAEGSPFPFNCIGNVTSSTTVVNRSTGKTGIGYLYNDSDYMYLNETKLNNSIDSRAVNYSGGANISIDGDVISINKSFEKYDNSNINTTSNIEELGFNITTDLKSYFDTIYQAIGNYVTNAFLDTNYYNKTQITNMNGTWNASYWDSLDTPSDILLFDLGDVSDSASDLEFLQYNQSSGNWHPISIETTYYDATQSAIIEGTVDGGTLSDTQHSDGNYDGITFNFSETSGSPGLDLRVNFTGVDKFDRRVMRYRTSDLKGTFPKVQMWNYNTNSWDDYPTISISENFAVMTQPVFYSENLIQDGVAQMRIYKADSGKTGNHYYIDWIAISKGFGTPSGQEVDPLSIHRDGTVPLTDNWDAGDYNITAQGFNSTEDLWCNQTDCYTLADFLNNTVGGGIFFLENLSDINISDKSNNDLLSYNSTSSKWEAVSTTSVDIGEKVFFAYDAAGNIDITGGWTDMTLDTEVREDDAFTHTSDGAEVTINKNGTYEITADAFAETTGGRDSAQWYIAIDSGDGYSEMPGTRGGTYHRLSSNDESTMSINRIYDFNVGDKIKLVGYGDTGVFTSPNGVRLQIIKLVDQQTIDTAIQGPQGQDGANGTDGAPGDIIWQGVWSAGEYLKNYAVEHNGNSYVAITTTSDEPPSADWDLIAQRGDDGDVGAPEVYVDSFVVSSTGNISISGLGFAPHKIEFRASLPVDEENLGGKAGDSASDDTGFAGNMIGFARKSDSTQKAVSTGGSGSSINNIRYGSSDSKSIYATYGDQNANEVARLEGTVVDWGPDNFTVNIDTYSSFSATMAGQVIHYTAYGAVNIAGNATDVSDDGTKIANSTGDINFGINLAVTDDGDGSVTVDASGGGGNTTEEIQNAINGSGYYDINVDKLDGKDGSYYLDDTTINNCSADGSCDTIHYDSELRTLTNTSVLNSSNITCIKESKGYKCFYNGSAGGETSYWLNSGDWVFPNSNYGKYINFSKGNITDNLSVGRMEIVKKNWTKIKFNSKNGTGTISPYGYVVKTGEISTDNQTIAFIYNNTNVSFENKHTKFTNQTAEYITLKNSPKKDSHAVTKKYVDRLSSLSWKNPVLDKDLSSPPSSEDGDRYIVGSSPSGAWSGHEDDITEYNGTGWEFESPVSGWAVVVKDESKGYTYDGENWVVLTGETGEGTATVTTESKIYYVDADSGVDDSGRGNETHPYKTLQYAWDRLPDVVAHDITIVLKSATNSYEGAKLDNKFFSSEKATMKIKGQTSTLDSGNVGSVANNQDDPTYGSDADVGTLTDISKFWMPDAHEYKLVRVNHTNERDQYRIIIGNTETKLYVIGNWGQSYGGDTWQLAEQTQPNSTWDYEILDWDTELRQTTLESITGSMRFETIEIRDPRAPVASGTTAHTLWIKETVDSSYTIGCKISTDEERYGVTLGGGRNYIVATLFDHDGATGTRRAISSSGGGTDVTVSLIKDWAAGISTHGEASLSNRGSRFLNIGAGDASQHTACENLRQHSYLINDGSWGTVVFDWNPSYEGWAVYNEPPNTIFRIYSDMYYTDNIDYQIKEDYWRHAGDNYLFDAPIVFNGDTSIKRTAAHEITTNATILPEENETYDLGSTDFAWNNVYAKSFVDLTPFSKDKQKTLDEVMKIKADKKGKLNHSTLPDSQKYIMNRTLLNEWTEEKVVKICDEEGNNCYEKIKNIKKHKYLEKEFKNGKWREKEVTTKDKKKTGTSEGRNLGGAVSDNTATIQKIYEIVSSLSGTNIQGTISSLNISIMENSQAIQSLRDSFIKLEKDLGKTDKKISKTNDALENLKTNVSNNTRKINELNKTKINETLEKIQEQNKTIVRMNSTIDELNEKIDIMEKELCKKDNSYSWCLSPVK